MLLATSIPATFMRHCNTITPPQDSVKLGWTMYIGTLTSKSSRPASSFYKRHLLVPHEQIASERIKHGKTGGEQGLPSPKIEDVHKQWDSKKRHVFVRIAADADVTASFIAPWTPCASLVGWSAFLSFSRPENVLSSTADTLGCL